MLKDILKPSNDYDPTISSNSVLLTKVLSNPEEKYLRIDNHLSEYDSEVGKKKVRDNLEVYSKEGVDALFNLISLKNDEAIKTILDLLLELQLEELLRNEAELLRVNNEQTRLESENLRVIKELERIDSESARILNELKRLDAESNRINTFDSLQSDIELLELLTLESLNNLEQVKETAETVIVNAKLATNEANISAQNATKAATTAAQTEASIKQAETLRVTAEDQRKAKESERESAEESRKQAESGRVTAEQDRVSAESGRVTAEQSRASAEQQRVTEFATLKHESETATTNANEAAEKANQAAEGITDRLSETYPNFAAIQASGETNPNKIYIDAETNTSYRYNGSEFVRIGGSEKDLIINSLLYDSFVLPKSKEISFDSSFSGFVSFRFILKKTTGYASYLYIGFKNAYIRFAANSFVFTEYVINGNSYSINIPINSIYMDIVFTYSYMDKKLVIYNSGEELITVNDVLISDFGGIITQVSQGYMQSVIAIQKYNIALTADDVILLNSGNRIVPPKNPVAYTINRGKESIDFPINNYSNTEGRWGTLSFTKTTDGFFAVNASKKGSDPQCIDSEGNEYACRDYGDYPIRGIKFLKIEVRNLSSPCKFKLGSSNPINIESDGVYYYHAIEQRTYYWQVACFSIGTQGEFKWKIYGGGITNDYILLNNNKVLDVFSDKYITHEGLDNIAPDNPKIVTSIPTMADFIGQQFIVNGTDIYQAVTLNLFKKLNDA